MEKLTLNELFETSRQRKMHCHLIDSELEVNRIETVLKNGYNINNKTIIIIIRIVHYSLK